MTSAEHARKNGSHSVISDLRAMGFSSAVIVGILTMLARLTDALPVSVTFYLLLPGTLLQLLITGGHGGTSGEEFMGLVLGFLVNSVFYCALLTAILFIFRRIAARKGRH